MEYLSGLVFNGSGFSDGYVGIENGIIAEVGDGKPPGRPIAEGIVTPGLVNAHTHSADGLLAFSGKPDLKELVMPPNGMKHVYLKNASEEELVMSMRSFSDVMLSTGTTGFIDFREGGRKGVELMKRSSPAQKGMILGRPLGRYDANELNDILEVSDGIGLSSISDADKSELDAIADHVHRKGKVLGIHASERIREDIGRIMSLSPSFVVHMVEATDADMRMCADNNIPIVSCPRSNIFFGKTPPMKRLIDSGADIAIGTDNAMLCVPDMRAEAETFASMLESKGRYEDHIIRSLLMNCGKILYGADKLRVRTGMPADVAVFRMSGRGAVKDITDPRNDMEKVVFGRTAV
ncbi:MAG: amidohydrolase family protein [Methanomassiliicoccaceae archaeon]|nr:amidohydrolase family protein [Methanomassiliicoccaceae archaeon]